MKKMEHRIKKGVLFVPIFIGGLFLFTWIIMLLWNNILPGVITGVKAISYFQAMGILVLSKILFGGFGKSHSGGWRNKEKWMEMREKFSGMTPEEREKFKAEWKDKCGGRWGMRPAKTDPPTDITVE